MDKIVDALLHLQQAFKQAGLAAPAIVLGDARDEIRLEMLADKLRFVETKAALAGTSMIAGTPVYLPEQISENRWR